MSTQELIFRLALVGFGVAVVVILIICEAKSGEYDLSPVVKIGTLIFAGLLLFAGVLGQQAAQAFWGVVP